MVVQIVSTLLAHVLCTFTLSGDVSEDVTLRLACSVSVFGLVVFLLPFFSQRETGSVSNRHPSPSHRPPRPLLLRGNFNFSHLDVLTSCQDVDAIRVLG